MNMDAIEEESAPDLVGDVPHQDALGKLKWRCIYFRTYLRDFFNVPRVDRILARTRDPCAAHHMHADGSFDTQGILRSCYLMRVDRILARTRDPCAHHMQVDLLRL